MHKSDQIKITHSLIRQCLMACKLPMVLDLTDVCKKIYKFPAKKVLKILSLYSHSYPLSQYVYSDTLRQKYESGYTLSCVVTKCTVNIG